MAVLRTEEDFADLAGGYLGRARTQGVRHAEIFFDPQAHIERGVPMATVVDGLWSVLARSQERYGITSRLIMCFLRDRSLASAMETLEVGPAIPGSHRRGGARLRRDGPPPIGVCRAL